MPLRTRNRGSKKHRSAATMRTRMSRGWMGVLAVAVASDVGVESRLTGGASAKSQQHEVEPQRSEDKMDASELEAWTLVDRAAGATFWDHYDFFTARVSGDVRV
jgi:hypothetical protein